MSSQVLVNQNPPTNTYKIGEHSEYQPSLLAQRVPELVHSDSKSVPASAGQRLVSLFPEHSSLAPKVPTGYQV